MQPSSPIYFKLSSKMIVSLVIFLLYPLLGLCRIFPVSNYPTCTTTEECNDPNEASENNREIVKKMVAYGGKVWVLVQFLCPCCISMQCVKFSPPGL